MDAIGQNLAMGAALFFLFWGFLRRVPVIGFLVRMVTRAVLLISPVMVVVLVVGLVWFHGSSIFSGRVDSAAASPVNAPMPAERPGD